MSSKKPGDAFAPEMPSRAIQYAGADFIVPVTKVPSLLAKLDKGSRCRPESLGNEFPSDKPESATRESDLADAFPQGKPQQTIQLCLLSMSESTEDALWAAMRALEEKSALLRRMVPRSAALTRTGSGGSPRLRSAGHAIREILFRIKEWKAR